jgi:outer membrane protein assembly factor BamD (BamD/ComL family)
MLGQLLEADSPIKNIKEAINTYQSLCDSYPASKYWESANKRIIYLKRFYIDIH